MRYMLCQTDPIVGDIEGNKTKILADINQARNENCDFVIFPELSICGYPPDDLLDYSSFVDRCENAINEIALQSKGITIIIGGIERNKGVGRKLFNTAFILQNGLIIERIHKTLLPTYDIFTEHRYFEANAEFKLISINGLQIAVSICEDLWDRHNSFEYIQSPVNQLAKLKPDLHINICASPFHLTKFKKRQEVIEDCVARQDCPLIYLNQSAAHTGILFDGDSGVYNKQAQKVLDLPLFQEATAIYDDAVHNVPIQDHDYDDDMAILYQALVFGIRSYFEKMGFAKKALLGSSGGIDSAVIQALGSAALGAENVLAVLMPSEFSSDGSITDAEKLSKILGNPYEILPIKNAYDSILNIVQPIFKDTPFSVAEENIQARSRGLILMAISNKTGRFLLNTSNKSEMAVGYTTLYGDMCGGLCAIGDVYKTQLYELAKYINRNEEIIPWSIINKAPSAELRPDQKDSDSLPEYNLLDQILELYIEDQLGKEEIIQLGYDSQIVNRVVDLVNRNDFKRWQAAPVIKVSTKDFSYGRKMPLVAKHS